MNAVSVVVLASGLLLATAHVSSGQSQPGVVLPNAPAAMNVPQQLAGASRPIVDLYQRPDRPDRFRDPEPHPRSRHLHPRRVVVPVPTIVYGPGYFLGPGYGPSTSYVEETRAYAPAPTIEVAHGWLRLEALPLHAQVHVDGYYVGTVEDFGLRGRPMELTAGAHHVEVRARGYETLSFDVKIAVNDTVRYRGDLQSIAPAPAPPERIAGAAKPIYVIPNCYAGDRPPAGNLPSGCDIARMQIRK